MKKIVREVSFTHMDGIDGYKITSPDGELDTFYPVKVYPAQKLGYNDTVEISEEFFTYLALLSDRGIQIVFKR